MLGFLSSVSTIEAPIFNIYSTQSKAYLILDKYPVKLSNTCVLFISYFIHYLLHKLQTSTPVFFILYTKFNKI